jgi:predicted nucleic acid-binding protein
MKVSRLEPREAGEAYTLVSRYGLSFYDASYLYVAIRDGFTLVTEDGALRAAAEAAGCPVEKAADAV